MNNFDLIVPALLNDAKKVLKNINYIKEYIDYDNLIIVGNNEVKDLINKLNDKNIKFIDENKILKDLNYNNIKKLIEKRGGNVKRTGWYLQQFIKLSYANICKKDYYMTWDSDTVPVMNVNMFNNDKPYFDLKNEYHKPYFKTISKILNINKCVNESFISEHMLFNKKYVMQMIKDIESNNNIKGNYFFEKIINAIDIKDLNKSGFSEFETYGSYVMTKYPDSYNLRKWKSLREGIFYFPLPLNKNAANWIAKKYNAISFENHDSLTKLNKIWNNNFCYKYISLNFITIIMYPYMIIRKYFFK